MELRRVLFRSYAGPSSRLSEIRVAIRRRGSLVRRDWRMRETLGWRQPRGSGDHPAARFSGQPIGEGLPRLGWLLLAGARPRRRGSGFDLAVAENQHVRDLLLLGRPDLVLHPVRAVVDLDPETAPAEDAGELVGCLDVPVGDRDDHGLDGSEPERERP